MAVLLATFTNSGDAALAATVLRANGFAEAKVGTSKGDLADIVGIGATETDLYNKIVIGSAIAGAVALGALGFLLGMFSMDTPDIRGQGNLASIGPALSSLFMFLCGLATVGGIGGMIGGFLAAPFIQKSLRKAVEDGEAPQRPMITVPVMSQREEDMAHHILRQVGPPFEVIVQAA